MTPGPNNILALSSATSHGFRQSTRVLAGMSLGFLIVMLLCAGISFLVMIDPAAVHLLSWAGAAYLFGWRGKSPPAQRKTDFRNRSAFGPLFCFVNVENHFVRCYGTVDVCSAANTGAKLGSWRQRFAGNGTFGNVCWALAGHLFQRLFRQYGRQLNIVLALLLVYCAVRIFY